MKTTIGQSLRTSRTRTLSALALAIGIVIVDFLLVFFRVRHIHTYRIILAVSAVICLLLLAGGNLATVGLVFRPRYGFRYWAKVTLVLVAALVVLFSLVLVACWYADFLPYRLTPQSFCGGALSAFVQYPLLEETLYRLVLSTPLVALLGCRWAIVITGAVFAGLHFAYGSPAADNFVAGYFLAWAYLKSESIVIPMVWHALGNVCASAFMLASWYLAT